MASASMICKAKINLAIDVLGRAPDGYHRVRMVMMRVNFGDEVTVSLRTDGRILLDGTEGMPTDRQNIAYRAADAFFERTGLATGCNIHIKKRIPMGAGMAGGSADGAGVINMLNSLLGEPLTLEEKRELGLTLGADVPFCITENCALAEGIGEILTPLPNPPEMHFVIAKPKESISTAWAYENLDYGKKPKNMDIDELIHAIKSGDAKKVFANMGNIFESVSIPKCPEIGRYKETLLGLGADAALMSGTGSAVYGAFASRKAAENARIRFEKIHGDWEFLRLI